MRKDRSLPSYEQLFGDLDFRTGDESRSVYSPAAYLADLLQLLDDNFDAPSLITRRPDLRDIVLDTENTNTEVPYLDIVNSVLENAIGADPYETLRTLRFPFDMPFSLQNERLKKYLHHLQVSPEELYRQFASEVDFDTVAREYLGLSPEDVDVLTAAPASDSELKRFYQLGADEPLTLLDDVDRFRRTTMLTTVELYELLFEQLSTDERSAASRFFIHQMGTCVILDPEEKKLIWGDRSAPIPNEWFERVNRFVRLARKVGLSFTDLDLVLRSCCENRLDRAALRIIAIVLYLQRSYEFPIDVVASLAGPITTMGIGDEGTPQDLFNRTFNVPFAAFERTVIRVSAYPPTAYPGWQALPSSGDILGMHNKEFRSRVARALAMSEGDLTAIVTQFRRRASASASEPSPFDRGDIGLPALSLLHRISRLVSALDISVDEFFGVLDVLDIGLPFQWYPTFPILIDTGLQPQNCYRALEAADVGSSLWLMQTLFAVVRWMQASGFTSQELVQILGGAAARAVEQGSDDEQLAVVESIAEQFEQVVLTPGLFVSQRFSERASEVIHDGVAIYDDGVVSRRDHRLLRIDPTTVGSAAYVALTELATISKEDFLELGLDERLTAKIFTNLVIAGYLESSGALLESTLPHTAADFRLSIDFSSHRDALFTLIHGLCTERDAAYDVASCYPSDLAALEDLTKAEQAELYDNLIFHGYLDTEGDVLLPDFFARPENVTAFAVNADIDDVAPAVLDRLHDRVNRFRNERLALDPEIFADLPLTELQLAELLESLRFNEYIDRDGAYLDKTALAALRLDDLNLAPEFYPHRRDVVDAMKAQIDGYQAELYALTPDDFRDIADDAIARQVVDRLDGTYTNDDRVPEAMRPFFFDSDSRFTLSEAFTTSEHATIFNRIAAILREQQDYQLDFAALTQLSFDLDEQAKLVGLLTRAGYLNEALTVPENWLAYFNNVNNAVEFSLTGVEDYSNDVFFLLHALSKELTAGIAEITTTLAAQAGKQQTTLFVALQDAFGVPAETVEAICSALTGSAAAALDILVAPVLAAADGAVPADTHFRLAYRRIRRFALLAAKLGLDATEISVAFHDQDLVGKFPEPLALPPGVDRFDALLESSDGNVYLFSGRNYWTYSAPAYALKDEQPKSLDDLSKEFSGLAAVDAAFTDSGGTEWIIGRNSDATSYAFVREPGSHWWARKEQLWGKVRNNFTDPSRIDTAFVDDEGKTYLFCGDQYIRYSGTDYTYVDEGYPRRIGEWWEDERHQAPLPENFRLSLDASFQGPDGTIYLFAGDRFLSLREGATDQPIANTWGRVRNTFTEAGRVDAAYTDGSGCVLSAGNQVVRYSDSIENDGVCVDDGYPVRIESHFGDVPVEFEGALDAAFVDGTGVVHLFKDGKTVALGPGSRTVVPTAQQWGLLGPILSDGAVDSAFVGLDGKTYLFSGERYLRYSGADYAVVDVGYPRSIAADWGGLRRVDASVVLDGKTYLFGTAGLMFDIPSEYEADLNAGRLSPALRQHFSDHGLSVAEDTPVGGQSPEWQVSAADQIRLILKREGGRLNVYSDAANQTDFYVRYSTRNYVTPDPGYPRPLSDNWWNLPATLMGGSPFATIDAVLNGRDNQTYLFSGDQFVVFDNKRRWWSEPRTLAHDWDSLPFHSVDAAFVGKDGKTYIFSGQRYVRYSGEDYTRIDDRYPAAISTLWGNVVNNITRTGKVDAALVVDSPETVDGVERVRTFTYLFSGNQYVRYEGDDYTTVDHGYPKNLSSLGGEPRFRNLSVTLESGIDAAFADQRNVYLFTGGQCHVVSDALCRRYSHLNLGDDGAGCAFVEDGAVLVEHPPPHGWHRYSALEGKTVTKSAVSPRTLRTVPSDFKEGLNSVLQGVDGNTYLFQGWRCFDVQLNRAYPLAEEWGRPRNTIYESNTIDAAFVGRDEKTYVFSGDQFVVYTGATYLDVPIDGDPRPIQQHWGGLTSVMLAYVQNQKTYLFEKAGPDGVMRYVVYSGKDYSQPDTGYPRATDASFWKIPEDYRAEGFTAPDAVLSSGESMLLVTGEHYLQFTEATGIWVYPRPIDQLWPGFDNRAQHAGGSFTTAFTGLDGATYFFFEDQFTRYSEPAFSELKSIRESWGKLGNRFVAEGGTGKVDAAFVYRNETTFLFSFDQYARYSGAGYRYVDPGYPKAIVGNLRQEEAFSNLPESFDEVVAHRSAFDAGSVLPVIPVIDAVVANDRSVYLFVGGDCYVASRSVEATLDLSSLGRVRNTIAERQKVDAALVTGGHTFLFSGDQYVRYSGGEYGYVDDGYPRTLDTSLPAELGIQTLPEQFHDGIDAAFHGTDGRTYLFAGKHYLRVDPATPTPQPVSDMWGTVRNEFVTDGGAGTVDAAFVAPTGELYAFTGGQYVRYRPGSLEFVEEGYPRAIKDEWGNLPAAFEAALDGAFVFEGRTYLCKGEEYVRYSSDRYTAIDRTYPQRFRQRWSDTGDYQLDDVHTIARFTDLARAHQTGDGGLAAFLLTGPATIEDPYLYLSELVGWDIDELKWVKRHSDLWSAAFAPEDRFELEFVLKLADLFAVADKLGAGPSKIMADIWSRVHGTNLTDAERESALEKANTVLYDLLARRYGGADWLTLSRQLHDELNTLQRDALVPVVIAGNPHLHTSRDLFEYLLIDVDMGSRGTTSRIQEAIAATQLYLHRYFLNLEPVTVRADHDDDVRQRLKTWWSWMKNYRVWEANRKVFLYPENYLRPELRATKTPAFKALEEDLLQGEITPETVQRVYKRYLDEYTEVSRLAIAGGYVYAEEGSVDGARSLVLFGRTRTSPRRYYYRRAEFTSGGELSAVWQPWLKVEAQIDADRVHPVHAFGRVFVFWAAIEALAPAASTSTTLVTRKDGDRQEVSAPVATQCVKIYYSFYNLNGEWGPVQTLAVSPKQEGTISGVELTVQKSGTSLGQPSGDEDHESIVVRCSYAVTTTTTTATTTTTTATPPTMAFALNPEMYAVALNSDEVGTDGSAADGGVSWFSDVFDSGELPAVAAASEINVSGIVGFNSPTTSPDGPWFSVDHKGGSFLCRPALSAPAEVEVSQIPPKGNGDRLPTWDRIDAAFELPDETRYFFGNNDYVILPSDPRDKEKPGQPEKIADRWGMLRNNLTDKGVVDAVIVRGSYTYVFSGPQYFRYSGGLSGSVDAGYPKNIVTNDENFPQWIRIGAAFTSRSGVEYFFSYEDNQQRFSQGADAGDPHFGESNVNAVFVTDTHTYLFSGDQYIRYTGDQYDEVDEGYPKFIADNADSLPRWAGMGAAFRRQGTSYFFNNSEQKYLVVTPDGAEQTYQTRTLGIIPRWSSVDTAYVSGDYLYLASGEELVRYTLTDSVIPEFVDDGYPRWLPQRAGAVFQQGDYRYIFIGEEYARIEADRELDTQAVFYPIRGNWGGLPAEMQTGVDAALDSKSSLYLFKSVGCSYPEIHYVKYSKTDPPSPPYEWAAVPVEIVRLTTSTAYKLNQKLLSGGVTALLDSETQETDELPAFSVDSSTATTIKVRKEKVVPDRLPASSHLDFQSANGIYYWEIFFHAPLLIAQALNSAQRFEDAQQWYEYVFDPTEPTRYWRFLPFLAVDVRALLDSCNSDLDELKALGYDVPVMVQRKLTRLLNQLAKLLDVFQMNRKLTPNEVDVLEKVASSTVHVDLDARLRALPETVPPRIRNALESLQERTTIIAGLQQQHRLMGTYETQIKAYLEDPFDPHAIAQLRPVAYRRAVVMGYIDNLLDWGDMLFRQYTAESIDEARMLYILAYDLLGDQPENLGVLALPAAQRVGELQHRRGKYDLELTGEDILLAEASEVHRSITTPNFYVPDNSVFRDYWVRVEDRLQKIRQSLNIMGISQPVPLFEPPLDPMALVRSVAGGAEPSLLAAGAAVPVPHYRFASVFRKAQELVDKLGQFGNDLLSVLERRNAEELSLLQSRQEGAVLAMMRSIKAAQLQIATENLNELRAGQDATRERVAYYERLDAAGLSPLEAAQIDVMTSAAAAHLTGSGLKIGAAIAYAVPQTKVGPFIIGTEFGGEQVGKVLETASEIAESLGEGLSVLGELFGVRVEQERLKDDRRFQLQTARVDLVQIGYQVASAEQQLVAAQREAEVLEQEIANNESVATFMKDKFANAALYQWMSGQLSAMYFQSYNMAFEMARSAERAFRFERGVRGDGDVYIRPLYWDSQRNGLLAGESLGLDLERLGKAYVDTGSRGLEVTKRISLLELDPVALLGLKGGGKCEFALTEALFDYDFPGHFRRQIRTVAVTFNDADNQRLAVNATLTQISHKTVLEADPKAVKYLLDPKGPPPDTLRSDWRSNQQIALSHVDEYTENNGLFELRFDDDRYLPFEGTGAVSTWRLELSGRRPTDLHDVTITLKYSADHGGEIFANAVKGMLKPYPAARFFDVASDFPQEWEEFLAGDARDLALPFTPDMFPGMISRQITGIYPKYELADGRTARFVVNGDKRFTLLDGKLLSTPGLGISGNGAPNWVLALDGEKEALLNMGLVLTYKASVQ